MNTINAIIIDDEPLAHTVIVAYAKEVSFLEIKSQCYKAMDAYEVLKREHVDLIFLDINMPKMTGLDFLRTLENAPQVIITSAYEEYALQGFELQVADYLLKPFRKDRFLKALNIVKERLEQKEQLDLNNELSQIKKISLKVDKKILQVDVSSIQYIESYGNYVKVWIDNKFHLTPRTLSSFETELAASNFLKIHKSFIVQKRHIEYLDGNNLKMKNENILPIGKTHKKKLRAWFTE